MKTGILMALLGLALFAFTGCSSLTPVKESNYMTKNDPNPAHEYLAFDDHDENYQDWD